MESAPYINIHTHTIENNGLAIRSYMLGKEISVPPSPFSAAIHPWTLPELSHAKILDLLDELKEMDIVAIGETGLDYSSDIDKNIQRKIFEAHLDIASKRGLPVIIHCVKAFDDLLASLNLRRPTYVIFHGFTGSPQQAVQLVQKGYYLSYGANLIGNLKTAASLRSTPPENIFFETDAKERPIAEIYDAASKILSIPLADLKTEIYNNYKTIFK